MMAETSRAERTDRKLVIGLTGGIGSGKSLVANMLEGMGAGVVDSDAMAHEELARPEVIATLCRWWGDELRRADGYIDRQAMADIVFEDPARRAQMEAYLYPRLERRRLEMMAVLNDDPSVRAIVIDSPLLYEAGLNRQCDAVIFVESDGETRVRRVIGQRGWTEQEFRRREKLQKSLDMKSQAADYRVVNNSTVDALYAQVKPLFERLLAARYK